MIYDPKIDKSQLKQKDEPNINEDELEKWKFYDHFTHNKFYLYRISDQGASRNMFKSYEGIGFKFI